MRGFGRGGQAGGGHEAPRFDDPSRNPEAFAVFTGLPLDLTPTDQLVLTLVHLKRAHLPRTRLPLRCRVVVEHTIGRMRRFTLLSGVFRHRKERHGIRGRAVAGLVNRLIDYSMRVPVAASGNRNRASRRSSPRSADSNSCWTQGVIKRSLAGRDRGESLRDGS